MENKEKVKKTNPIMLLWRSFTSPSTYIDENQDMNNDSIPEEVKSNEEVSEEVIKELFQESPKRVKTIQEKYKVINFEKMPKVKSSEWKKENELPEGRVKSRSIKAKEQQEEEKEL